MTIYHYCTSDTFFSIIKNRCIWLSSLSQSNDRLEGLVAGEVLTTLAKDLDFDDSVIARMRLPIDAYRRQMDGFAMCLSRKGDLLSQWRGYAADGSGFSVGFSEPYLAKLGQQQVNGSFKPVSVVYDVEKQKKWLKPLLESLRGFIGDGAYGKPLFAGLLSDENDKQRIETHNANVRFQSNKADMLLVTLMSVFFNFKSEAFSEEDEVRLLTHATNLDGDSLESGLLFRHARNQIIPYRSYELSQLDEPSVVEVILGPKNPTPVAVVKRFLKSQGFNDVEVRPSIASYH